MKLTADQYYYVYFCMFEDPAMFKPLSYSSEFVCIRQPFVPSTDNASFKAKNIRAGSPDLFMSMHPTGLLYSPDFGEVLLVVLTFTINSSNVAGFAFFVSGVDFGFFPIRLSKADAALGLPDLTGPSRSWEQKVLGYNQNSNNIHHFFGFSRKSSTVQLYL